MVDAVVNNVMSTSLTPDLSTYMFKEAVSRNLTVNLVYNSGTHTTCYLSRNTTNIVRLIIAT